MPELPEVERVRSELEQSIVGAAFASVTVHRRDTVVIPGDPSGGFARNKRADRPGPTPKRLKPAQLLTGGRCRAVLRHGKQLAMVTDDDRAVLIHLGMTGALLRVIPGARLSQSDHVHVTWRLDAAGESAGRLVFRDPRRFGGLWGGLSVADVRARWSQLGPDALDARRGVFESLTGRRAIKAALLDQRTLAGVGNIYADEALFRARVRPNRSADSLTPGECDRLAEHVRAVLTEAIEAGGSTLRDYRGSTGSEGAAQRDHRVYGRAGQPCVRCGQFLEVSQVAQRTTVHCPACQM